MRVAERSWCLDVWMFFCRQQGWTDASLDCGERDLSCWSLSHGFGVGRGPSFWRAFLAYFLRLHLLTCDKLPTVADTLQTGRAPSLRRRVHPHICCITHAAAHYLSHANMSDPPPAKKPAFSLYGDLIAPNGDSSVITSGPVKYDMKPKELEPDAQKKKNGRVAFYISS